MAISEAARADLYTGLSEVLGTRRAETLMAYLPTFDPVEIATRDDLRDLQETLERRFDATDARIDSLDGRIGSLEGRMESLEGRIGSLEGRIGSLEGRMESLDRRMDSFDRRMEAFEGALSRLHLTLVTGLFVIVAVMVGIVLAGA